MPHQEKLVRSVSSVGNGAHVFVPKEWIGEEIILIREFKKPVEERILKVLRNYLKDISGAFLFGSYARGEERKGSDIDLFVISNKKLKITSKGFSVICVREEDFEKAIDLAPLVIYSMLNEAKPIINSKLLDELKKRFKPEVQEFKIFLRETNKMAEFIMETLEKEDNEYVKSYASVYSLFLRLRGVFIIKELILKRRYTNGGFKKWIVKNVECDFEKLYSIYQREKENKVNKLTVKRKELVLLAEFLKRNVDYLIREKKEKTK